MKAKTILLSFVIITFSISFSNCEHYYYVPNAQNVPLFKKKNKTKINIALSGQSDSKGIDAQIATAVTDHVGIIANLISVSGRDGKEFGDGTFFEIGTGYFKPLGQNFVFETYGGVGLGSVKNYYDPGNSKAKLTRYFIQPSIGYTTRGFEIALSSRLANLNYGSISNSPELDGNTDLEYLKNHKSSILLEPALTIRTGWDKFKIQLQFVSSLNLNNPKLKQDNGNVNVGLYLDL
ncbi:MAG: hypothetical protein ACWA42_00735 [Lutibacter sp.]